MSVPIAPMSEDEAAGVERLEADGGFGAMRTDRGNLPLDRIDVRAEITGLTSQVELTQDFINAFDAPLEATYVFPLPDRGAVTAMRMTADGRTVQADLQERAAAREVYDQAIASGRRASIAEEERPDVFTMRVGNILPGEKVSVSLSLVCPLPYEDGEATFRFPLVVAPRYTPGTALADTAVGDGYADDTDAVSDASRISPPVLLPGLANPVRLSIEVGIDPAGLGLAEVRSSLHTVSTSDGRVTIQPGERVNRDFVLRLRYGGEELTDSLMLVPDVEGDEGTYQLTVLPPTSSAPPRPCDLVLVLDRSGSMGDWKMVAARRAAARIVDTLATADRFAVLTFDDRIDQPDGLPSALAQANDRNRFRAVEHLARVDARGGTELLAPLRQALSLLGGDAQGRDAVLVLVTDGQVGNEDQILRELGAGLRRVRVHTVGIDQTVNAGFLGRLAGAGGGRCELVESEDRLDGAMDSIHRRIGAPLAYGLALDSDGLTLVDETVSPARMPDLFPGVPLVVAGRYRGRSTGSLALKGTTRDGRPWSTSAVGQRRDAAVVTSQWARAHVRDLEDSYASTSGWYGNGIDSAHLEKQIVDASLRFGVLSRFTAFVAVDNRVVTDGEGPHRVMQPVELPAGWEFEDSAPDSMAVGAVAAMPLMAMPASSPPPSAAAPQPFVGGPPTGSLRRAAPESAAAGSAGEHRALVGTRELARDEARRLREAGPLADYEQRELLADLASRLAAVLHDLAGRGVPQSMFDPLQELVAALVAGGNADALWQRAIRVLEDFADNKETKKTKRTFWKRG